MTKPTIPEILPYLIQFRDNFELSGGGGVFHIFLEDTNIKDCTKSQRLKIVRWWDYNRVC